MAKTYYVYTVASKQNGTLYIGVINNFELWMYVHKNSLADGFIKKYKVYILVNYEETSYINVVLQKKQ